jgi:phospholipid/cholesterol/gamma-HCH transport system substrate-binding protein
VSFVKSFGGATATYDANGHYTRSLPIFDALGFTGSPGGGYLTPKPAAERGSSPYLSHGNLRRCPGAAAPAPADGSSPYVDSGALANPDCDPSQTVRATG